VKLGISRSHRPPFGKFEPDDSARKAPQSFGANHVDQALTAVVNVMWFVVLGMFAHARAVDAGRTPWVWVVITLSVPVGFIVLGCFKTASCRREPIVATFDWSAA
jgi:hypothetical protein